MKTQGFTLSELLIALAILGLIATFTIPKILTSAQSNQFQSQMKETLSSIESIAYEAYLQGADNADRYDFFLERLNVASLCANPQTEACVDAPSIGDNNEPGIVLTGGAVVFGVSVSSGRDQFSEEDNWNIDVNGAQGPNTNGQDIIRIHAPRFSGTSLNPSCTNRALICGRGSTSEAYYLDLYSN